MQAAIRLEASARQRQRGVTLVIALVLLVAMMLAGVAIFRSVDTSTFLAANLAFKRDLENRASMGIEPVLDRLKTAEFVNHWDLDACVNGQSKSQSSCKALWQGWSYSPRLLEASANGVPAVMSDIAWTASDATPTSTFDTTFSSSSSVDSGSKTRSRYLIERVCTDDLTPSEKNCVLSGPVTKGGDASTEKPGSLPLPLFRVTVRIEGPRNSVSYAQSIVSVRAD